MKTARNIKAPPAKTCQSIFSSKKNTPQKHSHQREHIGGHADPGWTYRVQQRIPHQGGNTGPQQPQPEQRRVSSRQNREFERGVDDQRCGEDEAQRNFDPEK